MATASEAEVMTFLGDFLRGIFQRDITPSPQMKATDVVGWDSMKQVEITLALEEKYDIRIRARELNSVANVGELVALVIAKTSETA